MRIRPDLAVSIARHYTPRTGEQSTTPAFLARLGFSPRYFPLSLQRPDTEPWTIIHLSDLHLSEYLGEPPEISRKKKRSKQAGGTPAVRAPVSAHVQRGESPLQAYALRPVTEGNCVAARRGGEQPEVRDQSAGSDELDSA